MTLSAFTRSLGGLASLSLALLAGSGAAQDQAPQPAVPVQVPSHGAVQAETLGALDLWSTPGRDTGLPADLWRGASPDLVRAVLGQIDGRPLDPALAALARRTLATGANAPDGAGNDAALAALRARALLNLGDAEAAQAILSRASNLETSEAQSRVKAETALLLGRDQEACDTGQALQENRNGAWWLALRAYCSLVAGKPEAAQVTLDLWRQAGGKDAAFDRLATAAATGATNPKTPLKASLGDPLNFALSKRLKLDLAPAIGDASPAVVAAIARDADQPRPVRLAAAARALRLGALPPEAVRAIYLPVPTGAEAVTDGPAPPSLAELAAKPGAESEAALWTLADRSADPVVRAQAATALLKRTKTAGEFDAMARLTAPAIAFAAKANAAMEDSVLLATASAAAGDLATAGAIRGAVEQDKAPGSAALDLALLDAIIAARSGQPAGPVLDRLIERGAVGDAKPRARAQAAALLVAALGDPMSAEARAQFAGFDTPAAKISPERAQAMMLAGLEKRRGEAAMLAVSVGLQQPSGPAPAERAQIVSSLKAAGLNDGARAVAVEGLVALARY
jgi:hypothetical protein